MPNWNDLATSLASSPGSRAVFARTALPDPAAAGFRRSLGLPVGQRADWRMRLDDCRGLHLWDCGEVWVAHVDQVDPSCDLEAHLRIDASAVYVGYMALIGGFVGAYLAYVAGIHPMAGVLAGALAAGIIALAAMELSSPAAYPRGGYASRG